MIQRYAVGRLLDASVLTAVNETAPLRSEGEETLSMAEIFDRVTVAAFDGELSKIDRGLQRIVVDRLKTMVLGRQLSPFDYFFFYFETATLPEEAKALAWLELREIEARLGAALDGIGDDADRVTVAHLQRLRDRIEKILEASVAVNTP